MFGYIRTDTPEMRVRENEYYRAVYCGLCKAQGKCTGQCSRFTLSYDVVFLALLRMAVTGEKPTFKSGNCIAHPFKKRAYAEFCDSLAYCSYAYAILAYGKNIDDLYDEKGGKRLKARLAKPFTAHMRKKALKKNFKELDESVREGLRLLSETEKEKMASVDVPAERFGEIMSDILSYGLEGTDAKIMKNIGKHLGRWIYIIDAADDLAEDLERKRYNPFACLYGNQPLTPEQRESVAVSLKLELMSAEPAFDLLDFDEIPDIEGIIHNIIYSGMPDVAERVLEINGKCRKTNKKPSKGKK